MACCRCHKEKKGADLTVATLQLITAMLPVVILLFS